MREERVEVSELVRADAASVWAVAGDFCGTWHPAIATIREERDGRGALIRAFTAHGEGTLYRERLTYRSDSDRTLAYIHLQGIEGAQSYSARLTVSPADGGGSRIDWTASIVAEDARAAAIASGTKTIFEMGITALQALPAQIPSVEAPHAPEAQRSEAIPVPSAFETVVVEGDPHLSLTVTPARSGPLVLFLHGIGGGRSNWLAQLGPAAAHARAAALDLRGYGDSGLGQSQSTVEDYCNDIDRAMAALGADRVILCGLSYGAWLATSYAMRRPGRLAGLVLSGGCTGMSEAAAEEREAFRRAREVPLDQGRAPRDFAPAVVDVLAGPRAGAEVRQRLLQSMSAISSATYRDALTCFTNPPERFDFSRLSMPVLMMTGEHDRLAPPAEIRAVAARIVETASNASVRFEVIPDAGHVCNVEQKDRYNAVLGAFLAEIVR